MEGKLYLFSIQDSKIPFIVSESKFNVASSDPAKVLKVIEEHALLADLKIPGEYKWDNEGLYYYAFQGADIHYRNYTRRDIIPIHKRVE